MISLLRLLVIFLAWGGVSALAAPGSAAPVLPDLTKAGAASGGFAVHVGASDVRLAAEMARTGRWVVHVLPADPAAVASARTPLAAEGLNGIVTVTTRDGATALPYPDRLVNLLVADLDTLGVAAPAADEIARVMAPLGITLLRKNHAWTTTRTPFPADMDGWTHFNRGPDNNPLSRDRLVAPMAALQWIAGRQTDMGSGTNCYRLDQGKAVYETMWEPGKGMLVCRDAFSGVHLWTLPLDLRPWKSRALVMQDGVIYTHLGNRAAPLVALDVNTGKTLHVYDNAAADNTGVKRDGVAPNLVVHEGVLYQSALGVICALDARSGAVLWRHAEEGRAVDMPTVAADMKRIFYTTGEGRRGPNRFVRYSFDTVVARDLATGKELWRQPLGEHQTTSLLYHKERLFLFEPINALEQATPRSRVALDARTGKVIWDEPHVSAKQNLVYTEIVATDAGLYLLGSGAYKVDPASGKSIQRWGGWGNTRCDSARATERYLLLSFGNFVDLKTGQIRRTDLTRGTCGGGVTPGHGMTYVMPARCACFDAISGAIALGHGVDAQRLPDSQRLLRGPAKPAPASPRAGEWPTMFGDYMRSSSVDTRLGASSDQVWSTLVQAPIDPSAGALHADIATGSDVHRPVTPVTLAGGRLFVAAPDQHRLDCLDALSGKRLWSFTAGGRIDGPPTVDGGRCLLGAHDGRVYALDAATGGLLWSYLLAPTRRVVIDHGQIASAWPVRSALTVAGGKVWAVAGRHPDADGGMALAVLDPDTGHAAYTEDIVRSRRWLPADGRTIDAPDRLALPNGGFESNRVRNSLMRSDGATVQLDIVGWDVAKLAPKPAYTAPNSWSLPEVVKPAIARNGVFDWMDREDYAGPGGERPWVVQWTVNPFLERSGREPGRGDQVISRADRNAWRGHLLVDTHRGKLRLWDLKRWDATIDGDTNSPRRTPAWSVAIPAGRVMALLMTADEVVVATISRPQGTSTITRWALADGSSGGAIQAHGILMENSLAAADAKLYAAFEDGTVRCWSR